MYLQRKDTTFLPGLQVFLRGNRFFSVGILSFSGFLLSGRGVKRGNLTLFLLRQIDDKRLIATFARWHQQ